jgi:hypothetical protein
MPTWQATMSRPPNIIDGIVKLRRTRQRRLIQRLTRPHLLLAYTIAAALIIYGIVRLTMLL